MERFEWKTWDSCYFSECSCSKWREIRITWRESIVIFHNLKGFDGMFNLGWVFRWICAMMEESSTMDNLFYNFEDEEEDAILNRAYDRWKQCSQFLLVTNLFAYTKCGIFRGSTAGTLLQKQWMQLELLSTAKTYRGLRRWRSKKRLFDDTGCDSIR